MIELKARANKWLQENVKAPYRIMHNTWDDAFDFDMNENIVVLYWEEPRENGHFDCRSRMIALNDSAYDIFPAECFIEV